MKVYAMNVSGINPDDKKWYKYLPDKRIEKVKHLKKSRNKAQSIGVQLLLNYAVERETGNRGIVKWDTESGGKPYLTEYDGLYVNLSHSGDYAVCAVHSASVGVDIQRCRECDMGLAERFSTHEECEYINGSADKNSTFFEVWTKKESFVKAIGTGITIPLGSFSVLSDLVEYGGAVYKFKEYTVKDKEYKLFVCYSV